MALAHLIKTIHEPLTKVGLSKSVLVNDVCFLKCENIAMQCIITMHCYSIDSIACIAEYITSTPAQVKSTNQKGKPMEKLAPAPSANADTVQANAQSPMHRGHGLHMLLEMLA